MSEEQALARIRERLFRSVWNDVVAVSDDFADSLLALSEDRELFESSRPLEKLPRRLAPEITQRHFAACEAKPMRNPAAMPVREITEQAQRLLEGMAAERVALTDLAACVAEATGYEESSVRGVIRRNFVSDGDFVWK